MFFQLSCNGKKDGGGPGPSGAGCTCTSTYLYTLECANFAKQTRLTVIHLPFSEGNAPALCRAESIPSSPLSTWETKRLPSLLYVTPE